MRKHVLVATVTTAFLFLIGCGDGVLSEAFNAQRQGRIIDNGIMSSMYPSSFRPGTPPYLERDFEAGADFICEEIKIKRQVDICSESDINWH